MAFSNRITESDSTAGWREHDHGELKSSIAYIFTQVVYSWIFAFNLLNSRNRLRLVWSAFEMCHQQLSRHQAIHALELVIDDKLSFIDQSNQVHYPTSQANANWDRIYRGSPGKRDFCVYAAVHSSQAKNSLDRFGSLNNDKAQGCESLI